MNQLPYPGDSVSSASGVAATRLRSGPISGGRGKKGNKPLTQSLLLFYPKLGATL